MVNVALGIIIGWTVAQLGGGWFELVLHCIRRKHDALFVDVRYCQPHGTTHWAVYVTGFDGKPERLIAASQTRLLAVLEALRVPKEARRAD